MGLFCGDTWSALKVHTFYWPAGGRRHCFKKKKISAPEHDNSCNAKIKPVCVLQRVYTWSCSTGQTKTLALDFVDTAVIDDVRVRVRSVWSLKSEVGPDWPTWANQSVKDGLSLKNLRGSLGVIHVSSGHRGCLLFRLKIQIPPGWVFFKYFTKNHNFIYDLWFTLSHIMY